MFNKAITDRLVLRFYYQPFGQEQIEPNRELRGRILMYGEGRVSVNTRFADEDVWLTQAQLVEIYQSSKSNISEHIKHIFEDKELDETVVVRKFRTTTQHGAIEGKTQ